MNSSKLAFWKLSALVVAGSAFAGCATASEPQGIPEAGIADLVVTETVDHLKIEGLDHNGELVAVLSIRIGMVQPEDFEYPALGRSIRGRLGDAKYQFEGVGLYPFDLPADAS